MNMFETLGEAQLLRHEGNRQLAFALADGTRALLRRLAQAVGKALRYISRERAQQ
jgi:hypothetical protein